MPTRETAKPTASPVSGGPGLLARLSSLAAFKPLQSARLLVAAAGGAAIPARDWIAHVDSAYQGRDVREAPSWPVSAIRNIGAARQRELGALGVRTVADLARLDQALQKQLNNRSKGQSEKDASGRGNGFSEPPSAPEELMPGMVGAIASTTRLSSFVRERELRDLRFAIDAKCVTGLAFDPSAGKSGPALGDIFTGQACPVTYLGFVARHTQRWINLGTHLGEVVHSVSLAPGESRNVAIVDWRRRSRATRIEDTSAGEQVVSQQFHQRALDEVARAVAEEHQYGKTRTEASTGAMAGSFVVAGAVVGGVAGGVTGAIIGTVIEPGAGTAIGAAVGGASGAAAGVAAGGLVYSGAHTLGLIEASSAGDRDVVGEVQQNILQSVSQKSSAIRSIYSSIVVEESAGEAAMATSSNITNYNHMHALNIEYYEVLQQYLTTVALDRAEPVMYLPFGSFDFLGGNSEGPLAYIRDYWHVIREHLDEKLRAQGDLYMVEDGVPDAADLAPLPALPIPPVDPAVLKISELEIWVLFKAMPFTSVSLQVRSGSSILQWAQTAHSGDPSPIEGWPFATWFEFAPGTELAAKDISGLGISYDQALPLASDLQFSVVIRKGRLWNGSSHDSIAGEIVVGSAWISKHADNPVKFVSWDPDRQQQNSWSAYEVDKSLYDQAVARNNVAQQAWQELVAGEERFRQRLRRELQRRRHHFTRVILGAIEPEQITHLLEALHLESGSGASSLMFPLSMVAHTIPIGMTNSSFLLRLKPWPSVLEDLQAYFALRSGALSGAAVEAVLSAEQDAAKLFTYSREIEKWFEVASGRGAFGISEQIYLPTGGLFAEAILGRANSAEVLDLTRYFNWQDSPIPNSAPPVAAPSTESRYQAPTGLGVTTPMNTINLVSPVALPDPTGMKEVMAAVRSGDMFRDMSKADQLATILGGLATLAGKMGEVSAEMTGDAAQQALKSATDIGAAVSQMAGSLAGQAMQQIGAAPTTLTDKGMTRNAIVDAFPEGPERDQLIKDTLGVTGKSPVGRATSTPTPTPTPTPTSHAPGAGSPSGPGANPPGATAPVLAPITAPGQIMAIESSAAVWKAAFDPWQDKFTGLTIGPTGEPVIPSDDAQAAYGVDLFNALVLPALQQAASDDRLLPQALLHWAEWLASMQSIGMTDQPPVQAAREQGRIWIVGGLRNAVQMASDRAVATNDWRYLHDALHWSASAQQMELAEPANRLHQDDVLADFPLQVAIVQVAAPAALAPGASATFAVQAGLRIGDNPVTSDEPLQWQLLAEGGSFAGPGSGQTNSLGSFASALTRAGTGELTVTVRVSLMWESLALYATEQVHAIPLPV